MANIAIIGSGIAGLGAGFLLNPVHNITVYEQASYIGGHARTLNITYGDYPIAVDTGFIVFNYRNYPNLSALFRLLNVPVQKSVMSFAVTTEDDALEWSAENLNGLFGQRRNIARPDFYRFLLDVLKFNRTAEAMVEKYPQATLGELVKRMGLGDWFLRFYILPMGGAIWSCSLQMMLGFPAAMFVTFFAAHGLLTVTQQPQWYTVTGGSRVYLDRVTQSFRDRIRTNCGAERVTRQNGKVQVFDNKGGTQEFDQVVFAGHGDDTLKMLSDAMPVERDILGQFTYQRNTAVLHKDTSLMPRRRRCWGSWVYHAGNAADDAAIGVTYWMNHLQGIDENYPLFVTLNPQRPIADEHVFDRHDFWHPVYTPGAVAAQRRMPEIQGKNNSWFCGAHLRNGFHEDGLASAVDVAQQMGVTIPWR